MAQTAIRASKQIFFDDDTSINSKKLTSLADPTNPQDAATKSYVDGMLGANDAMVFKGTVGTGGTVEIAAFNSLATYGAGWAYRVITAGTIKGKICEIGDMLIAIVDRAGSGNIDADWTVVQTNIDGAVTGPASATDGVYALFDGVTGKVIKAGGSPSSKVDSNNAITGATKTKITYDAKGLVTAGADATTADIADSTDKRYCTDAEKTKIANALIGSNYIVREVPSGTKNGSNQAFVCANTPVSGTEMVFLNGILQNAGAGNDYQMASNTINMIVAPISTDVILVTYWK